MSDEARITRALAEKAERERDAAYDRFLALKEDQRAVRRKKEAFRERKRVSPYGFNLQRERDELNSAIVNYNKRKKEAETEYEEAKKKAEEAQKRAEEAQKRAEEMQKKREEEMQRRAEEAQKDSFFDDSSNSSRFPSSDFSLSDKVEPISQESFPKNLRSAIVELKRLRAVSRQKRQEFVAAEEMFDSLLDYIAKIVGTDD